MRNMSKKSMKKIRKQVRFFSIRMIAERLMEDKPIQTLNSRSLRTVCII